MCHINKRGFPGVFWIQLLGTIKFFWGQVCTEMVRSDIESRSHSMPPSFKPNCCLGSLVSFPTWKISVCLQSDLQLHFLPHYCLKWHKSDLWRSSSPSQRSWFSLIQGPNFIVPELRGTNTPLSFTCLFLCGRNAPSKPSCVKRGGHPLQAVGASYLNDITNCITSKFA